jgi:23S rRNA pseudouridine1911/1915/1917 synthase
MTAGRLNWIVAAGESGVRLDKFLAAPHRLGSRARAAAAIERGKVYLNDVEVAIGDARRLLADGDAVGVWMDKPGTAKRGPRVRPHGELDIVYEDDQLIVVIKPPGVLSVPLERNPGVPSIYDLVLDGMRSHGKRRPLIVHRIDQDTSGLVVFAKDAAAQTHLKDQFKQREPERVYLAIVYGRPDPPSGIWRDRLVWDEKALIQKETHPTDPRGSQAVSEYRLVEPLGEASLLEIHLRTGRRNQIRIQARLRGHTLVGETRYVFGPGTLRPITFHRHALHAWRLAFRHPEDDRMLRFEAPLPPDLIDLIAGLRSRS